MLSTDLWIVASIDWNALFAYKLAFEFNIVETEQHRLPLRGLQEWLTFQPMTAKLYFFGYKMEVFPSKTIPKNL